MLPFSIIDFIAVAIIIFSALMGFSKGLSRSIVGLIGGILSLVIAIFLAEKLIDLADSFFGVREWLNNIFTKSMLALDADLFTMQPTAENIADGLERFYVPAVLAEIIAPTLAVESELTLVEILAPAIANIVLYVVATLILFALLRILLGLLDKVIEKTLFANKQVQIADRIGGLALGIARGVVSVVGIVLVIVLLMTSNLEFIHTAFTEIEKSFFGKYALKAVYWIIENFIPMS